MSKLNLSVNGCSRPEICGDHCQECGRIRTKKSRKIELNLNIVVSDRDEVPVYLLIYRLNLDSVNVGREEQDIYCHVG